MVGSVSLSCVLFEKCQSSVRNDENIHHVLRCFEINIIFQ